MGIQPTGKICGSLIVSLDKFRDEYGISDFFNSMKCPCGKCSGFGKGRSGTFTFESKNNINFKFKVIFNANPEASGVKFLAKSL